MDEQMEKVDLTPSYSNDSPLLSSRTRTRENPVYAPPDFSNDHHHSHSHGSSKGKSDFDEFGFIEKKST